MDKESYKDLGEGNIVVDFDGDGDFKERELNEEDKMLLQNMYIRNSIRSFRRRFGIWRALRLCGAMFFRLIVNS